MWDGRKWDTKCSYCKGMKEEKLCDCQTLFLKIVILLFFHKAATAILEWDQIKYTWNWTLKSLFDVFLLQALSPFHIVFPLLATLSYFSLAWNISTPLSDYVTYTNFSLYCPNAFHQRCLCMSNALACWFPPSTNCSTA